MRNCAVVWNWPQITLRNCRFDSNWPVLARVKKLKLLQKPVRTCPVTQIWRNKRGWEAYTTLTSCQNAAYSKRVIFICWVYYVQEGSAFILRKFDFSSTFQTKRSWHLYRLTVVIVFWSAGFALWCKRIFFDLFWSVKLFYYGWIRVPIFSKVPSGSDLSDFL